MTDTPKHKKIQSFSKKDFPADSLKVMPNKNVLNYQDIEFNNKTSNFKKHQSKRGPNDNFKAIVLNINRLTIKKSTKVENLFILFNNSFLNDTKIEAEFNSVGKKEPEDSKKINRKNIKIPNHKKINILNGIPNYGNQKIKIKSKMPLKKESKNIIKRLNQKEIYKPRVTTNYSISNNFININPLAQLNLSEFTRIKELGKGTFGHIYSVKWKKNNKIYALKEEKFHDGYYIIKRKNIFNLINEFIDKTKSNGVIKIHSNLIKQNKNEYNYFELLELGEKDWEKEIVERSKTNNYYTEKELFDIASGLITTLSLLQQNHITHRDIKPQNVIIVHDHYKLSDYGEVRNMRGDGLIVQRVRGSELYMSPILFNGLRKKLPTIKHITYKSDVFSLGMCLLFAATLSFNATDEIREKNDMKEIKTILIKYLNNRYSYKFIHFIYSMLQNEERLRPDFIEMEKIMYQYM